MNRNSEDWVAFQTKKETFVVVRLYLKESWTRREAVVAIAIVAIHFIKF